MRLSDDSLGGGMLPGVCCRRPGGALIAGRALRAAAGLRPARRPRADAARDAACRVHAGLRCRAPAAARSRRRWRRTRRRSRGHRRGPAGVGRRRVEATRSRSRDAAISCGRCRPAWAAPARRRIERAGRQAHARRSRRDARRAGQRRRARPARRGLAHLPLRGPDRDREPRRSFACELVPRASRFRADVRGVALARGEKRLASAATICLGERTRLTRGKVFSFDREAVHVLAATLAQGTLGDDHRVVVLPRRARRSTHAEIGHQAAEHDARDAAAAQLQASSVPWKALDSRLVDRDVGRQRASRAVEDLDQPAGSPPGGSASGTSTGCCRRSASLRRNRERKRMRTSTSLAPAALARVARWLRVGDDRGAVVRGERHPSVPFCPSDQDHGGRAGVERASSGM